MDELRKKITDEWMKCWTTKEFQKVLIKDNL